MEFEAFVEDEHDEARKNHPLDEINCIFDHSIDAFAEPHKYEHDHLSIMVKVGDIVLPTFRMNLQKFICVELIHC